ncbi:MAG: VOC family protein [Spirochaetia bacterium]|jgi:catechol 2,3-dioxygenase-like lactoylglutathione lyase family enzyme
MPTQSVPQIAQLAHILLKVSDITRSERFYVDLLGFKVRPAKPLADGRPFVPFYGGLALTCGGSAEALKIDHIAFKVHDVAGIATRLRKAGANLYQDLHQGIYGLTIYVADPDGNKIELFEEGGRAQEL